MAMVSRHSTPTDQSSRVRRAILRTIRLRRCCAEISLRHSHGPPEGFIGDSGVYLGRGDLAVAQGPLDQVQASSRQSIYSYRDS